MFAEIHTGQCIAPDHAPGCAGGPELYCNNLEGTNDYYCAHGRPAVPSLAQAQEALPVCARLCADLGLSLKVPEQRAVLKQTLRTVLTLVETRDNPKQALEIMLRLVEALDRTSDGQG